MWAEVLAQPDKREAEHDGDQDSEQDRKIGDAHTGLRQVAISMACPPPVSRREGKTLRALTADSLGLQLVLGHVDG